MKLVNFDWILAFKAKKISWAMVCYFILL